MRGELDWIVMKALEKDRTRRYETANGFARDIERYLAGDPVEAWPAVGELPAAEVRPQAPRGTRHGGGVCRIAGNGRGGQHLAGRAGTSRPNDSHARRKRPHITPRNLRKAAWSRSNAQRQEAQINLLRARQVVDESFTLVSQSKLFDVPGLQSLRKVLLEAAVRYYQTLLREKGNDPALLADLAVAHLRVAQIDHEVDRNTDAINALEAALDVVERLRREAPAATDQHQRIAGFWKASRNPKYVGTMPEDSAEAKAHPAKVFGTLGRVCPRISDCDRVSKRPGRGVFDTGELGIPRRQPAPKAGTDVRCTQARSTGASIWDRLSQEHPENVDYRENVAMVLRLMKYQLDERGLHLEADQISERAFGLAERLAADSPRVPQYQFVFGECLNERGHRLERSGHSQRPLESTDGS